MNIKIELHAPELIAAILVLAEAMQKQQQPIQPTQSELSKEQEVSSSTQMMDVVKLRQIITEAIKDNKFTNAEVRTALTEFNVSKLTDLPSDQYEAFLGVLFEK